MTIDSQATPAIPAYAARLLKPREGVRYRTRPRVLSLGMFVFMAAVALALSVFSIIVEPGFIRLLSLPAIPVLGSLAAFLLHSPVIFVTDRRIVYARRLLKPLSFDLEGLEAVRVVQNRLGRLLGYGELHLLFQPPQDLGEGVFLRFTLSRLPDAASLASATSAAASALKTI
jgi:hypothetical protein